MKKGIQLIAIFLCCNYVYAQEYSNYQINRFGSAAFTEIAKNPAFTGLEGRHVLDLTYDLMKFGDWSFDQYKVDYSTNFGKKNQLGVGGYYTYDNSIFSAVHEVNASLAYKYTIKSNLDISIGLSAITFNRLVIDLEKIRNGALDPDDPLLQGSKHIEDRLDYNIGLWMNYRRFYFGFSCLDFFTIDLQGDDDEFLARKSSTHINSGFDISLTKDWHLSPTIYVMNIFEENDLYQFGLFADYANLVYSGITYKLNGLAGYNFFGFKGGVLLAKRIRATVGYEFTTDDEGTSDIDFRNWFFGLRLQY